MRLIRANGPITVAQYMTICLYDPEQGYYATREPIGAHGDFITAPEISQMFGEIIGLWCGQVWLDQGQNRQQEIVELGPGRGTLMADTLRALRVVPQFLSTCRVTMVEASAPLRQIQQKTLREAAVRIEWKSQFDGMKEQGPLFVIANEFFDALPVRQFVKTNTGWHERQVCLDQKDHLAFVLAPVTADAVIPTERRDAPLGAILERCDTALALVDEIARAIIMRGGAALIVDYGDNDVGESLQAVSAHEAAPVLERPGQSDLSAHVDFRALADVANSAGARAWGPLQQGPFLRALGIESRAERLGRGDSVVAALDRLTNPAAMGSLFKVLAIAPPGAPPPPGFS